MREDVLRQFFDGTVDAEALAADLADSLVSRSKTVTEHPIVDMENNFAVHPAHLIAVCDAVLAGELAPELLQAIGFCMVASDHFNWDTDTVEGNQVGEVLFDWSSPETNYPLIRANVAAWRSQLRGEPHEFEPHPTKGLQ
jgi:hypothetical protein